MDQWQYVLLALLGLFGLIAFGDALGRRRKLWKERDFLRTLDTVLLPRETVKCVCPQKKGRWVLTSRRLLIENGTGFTAVPLKSVRKVQGFTKEGKTTTSAAKMDRMTVKAEEEYRMDNTSGEFEALVKALQDRVRRQKRKK